MSTDTVVTSSNTTAHCHLVTMGLIREKAHDLIPVSSKPRFQRTFAMCMARFGTTACRHPEWDVVRIALYAVKSVKAEQGRALCAVAANVFARATLNVLREEHGMAQLGVSVIFEGTEVPLVELSSCQLHALQTYAWVWLTVDESHSSDELTARLERVVTSGNRKMPAVTTATKRQASKVFRDYVRRDQDPRNLLPMG